MGLVLAYPTRDRPARCHRLLAVFPSGIVRGGRANGRVAVCIRLEVVARAIKLTYYHLVRSIDEAVPGC